MHTDNHNQGDPVRPPTVFGAFDAKTQLAKLLDRVEQGEIITITRHGVPVATLRPAAGRRGLPPATDFAAAFARLRSRHRLGDVTTRELIDDGRRV